MRNNLLQCKHTEIRDTTHIVSAHATSIKLFWNASDHSTDRTLSRVSSKHITSSDNITSHDVVQEHDVMTNRRHWCIQLQIKYIDVYRLNCMMLTLIIPIVLYMKDSLNLNLKSKLQEYVMQNLQINSPNSNLIAQSFVTSFLHN